MSIQIKVSLRYNNVLVVKAYGLNWYWDVLNSSFYTEKVVNMKKK